VLVVAYFMTSVDLTIVKRRTTPPIFARRSTSRR